MFANWPNLFGPAHVWKHLLQRNEAWVLAGLFGLVLLLLSGCDGFGLDGVDEPPGGRVAMTAVYEETLESGRPVHRLVVADVQNPSNYKVLSKAGKDVGRSCFGPEKRRLLFEDNSESNVGSRAAIKLLDLESREVRDLGATGTLKGCVWRSDGSGFYYAAAGPAGLTVSTFYELETGEARSFAQSETKNGAMRGSIPYARKERDSILVLADSLVRRESGGWKHAGVGYYFVDAKTGTYLEKVENEHFRFVPWEDESRGGWEQGAFGPAYNNESKRITYQFGDPENISNIAVTNLDGNLFEIYGASKEYVDTSPRWGPGGILFFDRRPRTTLDPETHRIMVANVETEAVRELIGPSTINGAVALRHPDY